MQYAKRVVALFHCENILQATSLLMSSKNMSGQLYDEDTANKDIVDLSLCIIDITT